MLVLNKCIKMSQIEYHPLYHPSFLGRRKIVEIYSPGSWEDTLITPFSSSLWSSFSTALCSWVLNTLGLKPDWKGSSPSINSLFTPWTYCKIIWSVVISRYFGKYLANRPAVNTVCLHTCLLILLFVSESFIAASQPVSFLFWDNDTWTKNPRFLAGLLRIYDSRKNRRNIVVHCYVIFGFVVSLEGPDELSL